MNTSLENSLILIPDKTRIRDSDGFVATVRYVGPVASAKKVNEVYAGVEWDDDTRGKHDGSVICRRTNQIVRHFSLKNDKASQTQNGGSFMRLNKIDTGVDLNLQLIRGRYVDHDAPLVAPNNLLPYTARTSSGRDKPIEFFGEMDVRKRQQLKDLEDISLRGMGIARIPKEARDDMKHKFGHVKEIDMAGNLLSDWDAFCDILYSFPSLEWISFACNKIYDIPSTLTLSDGEWSRLRILNLNNCYIASSQTIFKIGKICPNMEHLCVANNDLADLTMIESDALSNNNMFNKLTLLDFSNCNVTDWDNQVRKISLLPKLESFLLDDNPIQFITMPKSESEFVSLSNLQIAGSQIKSWSSIECLAQVPNLKLLRFRKCPLTDAIGTGEARAGTIARIPLIEQLNASQITPKERLEAERRYVSTASRELLQVTSNMTIQEFLRMEGEGDSKEKNGDQIVKNDLELKRLEFYTKYPRFEELMVKHKETMLAAAQSSSSNGAISHNAVNVTISSMAVESCTIEPLQKRLPTSMKVGRLKMMCARAFGLDVDLQVLHYKGENDAFPSELDDDESTLAYFGVNDGAEILMNEIDVEAIEREDKNKVDRYNKRIEEQEHASNVLQAMQKTQIQAHFTATEKAADLLTTSKK